MTNDELIQTIKDIELERIRKLFAFFSDAPAGSLEARRAHWARWVAENPERAGTTWPAALIAYKEWRAAQALPPLDILPCEHPNAAGGKTCPDCDAEL